jgi:carbamoyltransferase
MANYVLGISCHYHDAAVTLLKNGKVVFAADEERFSRKKHDAGFPALAIQECLKWENISIEQIDHIAFYEKPFLKFERLLRQHLDHFPRTFKTFQRAIPSWLSEKIRIRHVIRKRLKYKGDVFFVEHHQSHAASAFLPSPFQEAAILTVDGVGEWTTTAIGIGRANSINLLKEIRFPHSIGLLYSTLTAYLGFSVNNSEYKVMGLSPYGLMDRLKNPWYPKLRRVIDLKPDGSYNLNMEYFIYEHSDRMPSPLLCELLGGSIRKESDPLEKRHEDIAAALQMVTEDAVLAMLRYANQLTGCENIVLSGGVALNSVCNGKILSETGFKKIWIQPNAGDGGNSMGAALFVDNVILGNIRNYVLEDAYFGPSYSSDNIESYLKNSKIKYSRFASNTDLVDGTAKMLIENQVIGWFQGRMEWGPRALGARSILSNPCSQEMKAILNEKVKHREAFRPFAPAVCVEDAEEYFECDHPVPSPADFMLMVYPIKEKYRDKLPAVTHVDGSGRLQTVRREQNPLYYDLIKSFGKISGVPILVNTSFNIRGEPIVCTPEDAYRCMMGTGIDCLIMGEFCIRREDNPLDYWDSESLAHD